MISALPPNCLTSKLSALQSEGVINFRLTGSKFFGTQRECSDWDFFTEDSDHTREFLRGLGFSPVNTYRDDATISAVFYWGRRFSSDSIHIQLVQQDMIGIKEDAQWIIKNRFLVSPVKSEMCITWQAVILTLLAAQIERPTRS